MLFLIIVTTTPTTDTMASLSLAKQKSNVAEEQGDCRLTALKLNCRAIESVCWRPTYAGAEIQSSPMSRS